MFQSIQSRRSSLFYRFLTYSINVLFITSMMTMPTAVSAQGTNLPEPGTLVPPSEQFRPMNLAGVVIDAENPFQFDFIFNKGEENLQQIALETKMTKLIKYFLSGLTVPEDNLWVNLSPSKLARSIPQKFGETEMGADLLAQDYLLKQLSSSLMYPEEKVGRAFWKRVYDKAMTLYGSTDIPVNTFNRIWIVPDKAVIYEKDNTAFIVESRLKVMLEEDYVTFMDNENIENIGIDRLSIDEKSEELSEISSQIVRDVLLPEVEKEVNEGANFAQLRQVYNAIVLASWYKENLQDSLLGKIYMDRGLTEGVDVEDKDINDKIYDQYIEALRIGTFDMVVEEVSLEERAMVTRHYFAGGADMIQVPQLVNRQGIKDNNITNIRRQEVLDIIAPQLASGDFIMASAAVADMDSGKLLSNTSLPNMTSGSSNAVTVDSFRENMSRGSFPAYVRLQDQQQVFDLTNALLENQSASSPIDVAFSRASRSPEKRDLVIRLEQLGVRPDAFRRPTTTQVSSSPLATQSPQIRLQEFRAVQSPKIRMRSIEIAATNNQASPEVAKTIAPIIDETLRTARIDPSQMSSPGQIQRLFDGLDQGAKDQVRAAGVSPRDFNRWAGDAIVVASVMTNRGAAQPIRVAQQTIGAADANMIRMGLEAQGITPTPRIVNAISTAAKSSSQLQMAEMPELSQTQVSELARFVNANRSGGGTQSPQVILRTIATSSPLTLDKAAFAVKGEFRSPVDAFVLRDVASQSRLVESIHEPIDNPSSPLSEARLAAVDLTGNDLRAVADFVNAYNPEVVISTRDAARIIRAIPRAERARELERAIAVEVRNDLSPNDIATVADIIVGADFEGATTFTQITRSKEASSPLRRMGLTETDVARFVQTTDLMRNVAIAPSPVEAFRGLRVDPAMSPAANDLVRREISIALPAAVGARIQPDNVSRAVELVQTTANYATSEGITDYSSLAASPRGPQLISSLNEVGLELSDLPRIRATMQSNRDNRIVSSPINDYASIRRAAVESPEALRLAIASVSSPNVTQGQLIDRFQMVTELASSPLAQSADRYEAAISPAQQSRFNATFESPGTIRDIAIALNTSRSATISNDPVRAAEIFTRNRDVPSLQRAVTEAAYQAGENIEPTTALLIATDLARASTSMDRAFAPSSYRQLAAEIPTIERAGFDPSILPQIALRLEANAPAVAPISVNEGFAAIRRNPQALERVLSASGMRQADVTRAVGDLNALLQQPGIERSASFEVALSRLPADRKAASPLVASDIGRIGLELNAAADFAIPETQNRRVDFASIMPMLTDSNRGRFVESLTRAQSSLDAPTIDREIAALQVELRQNPKMITPSAIPAIQAERDQLFRTTAPTLASLVVEGGENEADISQAFRRNGGISLNPALLNMQVVKEGSGVVIPLPDVPLDNININGLVPVILNITPSPHLPALLGAQQVSHNMELGFNRGSEVNNL